MPGWLQAYSRNQPVTHVVNAARHLALGYTPSDAVGASWMALAWVIALLVIFVPLTVSRYKSRA